MDTNRQGEGGSGSAENRDENRDAQKSQTAQLSDQQRHDIAEQVGLKPDDIVDLQQTGALSGRDDAAGGSGDDMTGTSSNEGTEKF